MTSALPGVDQPMPDDLLVRIITNSIQHGSFPVQILFEKGVFGTRSTETQCNVLRCGGAGRASAPSWNRCQGRGDHFEPLEPLVLLVAADGETRRGAHLEHEISER